MNVSLTPELEEFVSDKVASGRYSSASEVMREALRLLEERDQVKELRLEELKRQLAAGIADLDRGASRDFDVEKVRAEGRRRLASRKKR